MCVSPSREFDAPRRPMDNFIGACIYKSAAGAQAQSGTTTDCDRNLSRASLSCIIYWDAIGAVTAERTNNGIFVMLRCNRTKSSLCALYTETVFRGLNISPCDWSTLHYSYGFFFGSMGVTNNHFSIHDQTWYCPKFILQASRDTPQSRLILLLWQWEKRSIKYTTCCFAV